MPLPLKDKVALVTGASRGVGRGVALGLGEAGATVYVTGRTRRGEPTFADLGGTVDDTADAVTAAGGQGIAVRCDHADDAQVEAVLAQIRRDHGRLDVLVNNAWRAYEPLHDKSQWQTGPRFWEQPASRWDLSQVVGVRSAFMASWHAAPMMVEQGSGLIVNISFFAAQLFEGQTVYGCAKNAVDHMAEELRPHGVAVVSLYPGLVRTEGIMAVQEFMDLSNSESPDFQGRAVAALAADPGLMTKSGQILISAEVAEEYGFTDVDGKQPRSLRTEMLSKDVPRITGLSPVRG
jgi:NAD(P)-dependent dehydrogenase (short-subunit alcohol dehydrogenase family)